MSTQLTLFNDDSDQPTSKGNRPLPVPLRAAKHFNFPLQYHEVEGEYLYSLTDWVRGLTGETNNKKLRQMVDQYRKQALSDLESTSEKLPYKASDGKTYKRDFVIAYEAYRVAAYLRQTSDRPALKRVKDYLARAGAFIDQLQQNPQWAAARTAGMVRRNDFMAMIHDALHSPPRWVYATATNTIYEGVFGRNKAQLSEQLNTDAPRDKMSIPGLNYLSTAEWVATERLGAAQEITIPHALSIVREVADLIGEQVIEFEDRFGIDIVTGKPSLGSGE